jgi:DNA topoisomerase II
MSTKASQYQKKTPREHVLLRPDTYIGDIEKTTDNMYLCTGDLKDINIIKKKCTFVPGLLKLFDELLVNSRDAGSNDNTCNTIKVNIDNDEGCISIWNNGQDGIPVEQHPEHKVLVPSMIFGELLTSSNYDDTEKRTTGGRNGYGAKLANIFSTEFVVEVGDSKNKKKFVQHWYDNMSRSNKASVTKYASKISYIKITFYPDFEKLHLKKEDIFNDNIESTVQTDHLNLFKRRCYDIAGTTSLGVNGKSSSSTMKVYFNDNKLDVINFKKYIELYYKDETIYYDDSSNRWEVGVLYRPDNGFEVISFVNGIFTFNGGTHANHVVDQIIKTLVNDYILKKNKDIKINGALVKENLTFFINCVIENPAFSSQTKDTLTTKTNKFGSTYKANDTFLKKLSKCGIVEQVVKLAVFKETSGLKKTDGKKQVKIKGIPKLEDANKAGTKESAQCSLILTEGDSAKAFAMAGMGIVSKDYYGVFPLKGKLLNVREASTKVLSANDEINFLKQIIGLKQNVDYSIEENFSQLRYGRVIILTDQDYDGSHIKGLVMNFFHVIWPELIERSNFITSLSTPIVKLFKGKQVETFYNITEYEKYVEDLKEKKEIHLWKTKYYKGLGTSTSAEAKEYFCDIEDKLIRYFFKSVMDNIKKDISDTYDESNDLDAITLAFDKTRSDDRKEWLKQYDKNRILTYEQKDISYSDFVHKDLIHFSNDDTSRSIPSVIDGFKPSQRKIFFGASLRGLDKIEVKVAQLAGFVSDKAAYHHGEMSLTGAIVGMAQDYVGANNINILRPNGQFGSRMQNGKDSASPRYIWTEFGELTSYILRKDDEPILKYQDEDGMKIEPIYYLPILPTILINGAEGIGTGFSTKCPQFNPIDIINILVNKLDGEHKEEILVPWYSLFEGTIESVEDIKNDDEGRIIQPLSFNVKGNYHISNNHLIITELPIGESTHNYKEFLEKQLDVESNKKLKSSMNLISYSDNNTDKKVYFDLEFTKGYLDNQSDESILKNYHLVKKINTTNIHLYNKNGSIKKYTNIYDIINEFYTYRLECYAERKKHMEDKLEAELVLLSYKVKFILSIINKDIKINNKSKKEIEKKLIKSNYPTMLNGIVDTSPTANYNYLLGMNLWSLSYEKVEELKTQESNKESELKILKKTKIETMWKNELEELLNKYEIWYQNKLESVNDISSKATKSTKAKKTIKKKKSINV